MSLHQLGVAHYGLGEYAPAEQSYLKVVSLNPSPPDELHVKLADVYLKQGAYGKAYAQMQAYLRAERIGRLAAKVKKIMQEMEASGALVTPPNSAGTPKRE